MLRSEKVLGIELLMMLWPAEREEGDVKEGEDEMGDIEVGITPYFPDVPLGVGELPVGNPGCAEREWEEEVIGGGSLDDPFLLGPEGSSRCTKVGSVVWDVLEGGGAGDLVGVKLSRD